MDENIQNNVPELKNENQVQSPISDNVKIPHIFKRIIFIILVIILSSGGTYYTINHKYKLQKEDLQNQIDQLNSQLTNTTKPTSPSPSIAASPTVSPSVKPANATKVTKEMIFSGTYPGQGKDVTLVDGRLSYKCDVGAGSPCANYIGKYAILDINNDGIDDGIFDYQTNYGGSLTTHQNYLMLGTTGSKPSAAIAGCESGLISTDFKMLSDGKLDVRGLNKGPGDSNVDFSYKSRAICEWKDNKLSRIYQKDFQAFEFKENNPNPNQVNLYTPANYTNGVYSEDQNTRSINLSENAKIMGDLIFSDFYPAVGTRNVTTPITEVTFGSNNYKSFIATKENTFSNRLESSTVYVISHEKDLQPDFIIQLSDSIDKYTKSYILETVQLLRK